MKFLFPGHWKKWSDVSYPDFVTVVPTAKSIIKLIRGKGNHAKDFKSRNRKDNWDEIESFPRN